MLNWRTKCRHPDIENQQTAKYKHTITNVKIHGGRKLGQMHWTWKVHIKLYFRISRTMSTALLKLYVPVQLTLLPSTPPRSLHMTSSDPHIALSSAVLTLKDSCSLAASACRAHQHSGTRDELSADAVRTVCCLGDVPFVIITIITITITITFAILFNTREWIIYIKKVRFLLWHYDLPNYWKNFFKLFLESLWFGIHGSNIHFLLTPSQNCLNKKANVKNWPCCLKRRPRKANVYFPWPPLEAGHSISTFSFSFKRGRKLLFLIYKLLLIRWSPKEITLHQALKSPISNFYQD